MRNPECIHYSVCLNKAAHTRGRLDCEMCDRFAKGPEEPDPFVAEIVGREVKAMEEKTKECCHCKQPRPLSEFGVNPRAKDGLTHKCKACKKEQNATYLRRKRGQKSAAPAPGETRAEVSHKGDVDVTRLALAMRIVRLALRNREHDTEEQLVVMVYQELNAG